MRNTLVIRYEPYLIDIKFRSDPDPAGAWLISVPHGDTAIVSGIRVYWDTNCPNKSLS
jgi:hypothetical protein